jgi:hypothetical protein
MLRSVIAVVAGYLVFAFSAALLFGLSGVDPHAVPSLTFGIGSVVFGMVFAALGGWVAARLAPSNPAAHVRGVALVLATIALVSMVAGWGDGSPWSQLAALLLMAPSTLLGLRLPRSQ